MSRTPLQIAKRKDVDNVQLEIACMKAVEVDPSKEQETDIKPTTSEETTTPTASSPSRSSSGAASANLGSPLLVSLAFASILFL
jgi:hypothetical protein